MSENETTIRTEDQPSWADVVRHTEQGETVAVIAGGEHVADVVPPQQLDRLRETVEILSGTDLIRDLSEGLADLSAGRVVSAEQVAADLRNRAANE